MTVFPDGGIEFTLNALPGMIFVQYPASVIPPENTIGFAQGHHRQFAAMFKDGAWLTTRGRPLAQQPERYTLLKGFGCDQSKAD